MSSVSAISVSGAQPEGRPWKAAALWLLLLGPFFFASYGLANYAASVRPQVGSVVFEWEQRIPFLAWTIVPYWSIDALYAVSLFVCSTRKELDIHALRLLTATVVSVAVFLLFPLRFSFERPATDGVFGAMFGVLMGFDKPFNQAPSLHVSLLVILWVRYAAHVRGAWRLMLHVWFALIAISILTTYQHHFIDLPTGLWVGLLCLWLFPDQRPAEREIAGSAEPKRYRIGLYYLIPGIALAVAGPAIGGLAWALLWPAGALVLVGVVYFAGDASLFRKIDGRMARAASWLLLPYLLGAWINSRWWTRKSPADSVVADGVLLGRAPSCGGGETMGVKSVVDVAAELPACASLARYRAVPMLDLLVPSVRQIDAAVVAIESLSQHRPTLVYCALGYSRSAAAVAAWLVASGRCSTVDAALEFVREKRPQVVIGAAHRTRLSEWFDRGTAVRSTL